MIALSVLARDRKTSGLEFYRTARKLQKSLYFLMMRDFGTKDKVRDVKAFTTGMEPQDADLLIAVLEKYHIRKIGTYWPEWTIQHVRDTICEELNRLMCSIESAMAIWPQMRAEYEERRVQQDRALGALSTILSTLTLAADIFPVDADKFRPQVELIEKERALIKGWRKSDNKRFKSLA